MKLLIAFSLLVSAVVALNFGSNPGASICVINVNQCSANAPVCGRYGRSNLCKKFQNQCALALANCSGNIAYTAVNASKCNGIALNQRKLCAGSSTSSNLFGSNNNVQPIIINTGK